MYSVDVPSNEIESVVAQALEESNDEMVVPPPKRLEYSYLTDAIYNEHSSKLKGLQIAHRRLKFFTPLNISYENFVKVFFKLMGICDFNFPSSQIIYWGKALTNINTQSFQNSPTDTALKGLVMGYRDRIYSMNEDVSSNSNAMTKNGYNFQRGGPPLYQKSNYIKDFYPNSMIAQSNAASGLKKRARWNDAEQYYKKEFERNPDSIGTLPRTMNNYFTLGRTDHGLAFARTYINPVDNEIEKISPCPDGSVMFSCTERSDMIISLSPFDINYDKSIYIISSNLFGIVCFISYTNKSGVEQIIGVKDDRISKDIEVGNINRIRMIGSSLTCYNTCNPDKMKGTIICAHIPMVAQPFYIETEDLDGSTVSENHVFIPFNKNPTSILGEKFYRSLTAKEGVYATRRDIDGKFEFTKNLQNYQRNKTQVYATNFYKAELAKNYREGSIKVEVIDSAGLISDLLYNPDLLGDFTNFTVILPKQDGDPSDWKIRVVNIYEYISCDIDKIKNGDQMLCPDSRAIEAALYIGSKLPLFLPANANSWNSIWNGIKKFVSKEPIQSLISVGSKFLPSWGKVAVQAANQAITGKPFIGDKFVEQPAEGGGYDSTFEKGLNYN